MLSNIEWNEGLSPELALLAHKYLDTISLTKDCCLGSVGTDPAGQKATRGPWRIMSYSDSIYSLYKFDYPVRHQTAPAPTFSTNKPNFRLIITRYVKYGDRLKGQV